MFFFNGKFSEPNQNHIWIVGLHISSSVRKLEIALIGFCQDTSVTSITLQKSLAFDLPNEITELFEDLRKLGENVKNGNHWGGIDKQTSKRGNSSYFFSLSKFALLQKMIVSIEIEAITELFLDIDVEKNDVVLLTVDDPGIWCEVQNINSEQRYVRYSLSNIGLLAKQTGINVLDVRNNGIYEQESGLCSSLALPYWILLRGQERDRVVVDLGETARWTMIPSFEKMKVGHRGIQNGEICPCGSLLNTLTQLATKGGMRIDLGGKLSVQGQLSTELLDVWNLKSQEGQIISTDNCNIVSTLNVNYYLELLHTANLSLSALDILCTSVHWIAAKILEILNSLKSFENYDIILMGAAKQNGLLINRLTAHSYNQSFHSLSELGFEDDSFDAVACAVYGVMYISGGTVEKWDDKKLNFPYLFSGCFVPGTLEKWRQMRVLMNEYSSFL